MKLQKQLLEAVEHKQLRPLDVQFALTVAEMNILPSPSRRHCYVMMPERDTFVCRFHDWKITRRRIRCWRPVSVKSVSYKIGKNACWLLKRSAGEMNPRR